MGTWPPFAESVKKRGTVDKELLDNVKYSLREQGVGDVGGVGTATIFFVFEFHGRLMDEVLFYASDVVNSTHGMALHLHGGERRLIDLAETGAY